MLALADLDRVLRQRTLPPACDDVQAWWPRWSALSPQGSTAQGSPQPSSATLAVLGGADADRVGWAFAAGYQAALRALHPALPHDAVAALCVTEDGGNRPRDVRTTFTPLPGGGVRIDGRKRWTTLGPAATVLLVVGRWVDPASDAGADAARPQLRVAAVPGGTAGLSLAPLPGLRMVPEVPHAALRLDGVQIDAGALLPGDGYERVVKPFRTLEDTHVALAMVAHLLRQARGRGWPVEMQERLASVLTLLHTLATADAGAPATHVALTGALQAARLLYADAGAQLARTPDDPAAQRWLRDAPLFDVAAAARSARAQRAWERLG